MKTVQLRNKIKSVAVALLLVVMAVPFHAFAAETSSATAVIQVTSEVYGESVPEDAAFTYVLTADDTSYPMPASGTVTIQGNGSAAFDPIAYDTPGDYSYTVHARDDGVDGYTYDQNIYRVFVTVADTGGGSLETGISLQKNRERSKSVDIIFQHTYAAPVPETTPPETMPPETTPEVTPEATPEITPEVTPQVTPKVTPETTPEVTPEITPEVTPTTTPTVTPETSPKTTPVASTPNTGDTRTPVLWLTLLLASGTVIIGVLIERKIAK